MFTGRNGTIYIAYKRQRELNLLHNYDIAFHTCRQRLAPGIYKSKLRQQPSYFPATEFPQFRTQAVTVNSVSSCIAPLHFWLLPAEQPPNFCSNYSFAGNYGIRNSCNKHCWKPGRNTGVQLNCRKPLSCRHLNLIAPQHIRCCVKLHAYLKLPTETCGRV